MKRQDLLRKQADMMDMAEKYGISDWRQLVRVRNKEACDWCEYIHSSFNLSWWGCHKFALGVVEGKPVFEGDTLYDHNGNMFTATETSIDDSFITRRVNNGCVFLTGHPTWNPPKPKTGTIELPIQVIENAALWEKCHGWASAAIGEACRKALEDMK